MNEEFRTNRVRLELTDSQKRQIRKATGRTVNSLDLGLQVQPRPAEPPRLQGGDVGQEARPRSSTLDDAQETER